MFNCYQTNEHVCLDFTTGMLFELLCASILNRCERSMQVFPQAILWRISILAAEAFWFEIKHRVLASLGKSVPSWLLKTCASFANAAITLPCNTSVWPVPVEASVLDIGYLAEFYTRLWTGLKWNSNFVYKVITTIHDIKGLGHKFCPFI